MEERKKTDNKRFYPLPKRILYTRVFFWAFFSILMIEVVVLLSAYLIYHKPGMSIFKEAMLLVIIGCIIAMVIAFSILWVFNIIINAHDKNYHIKTEEDLELLADLNHALSRNELAVYLQPFINLQNNKVVGMEVLLRWHHGEKGIIMPNSFIHLAEKSGLIEPISEWTILQACMINTKLLDAGYNLRIAVNVSPIQFKNPSFLVYLQKVLMETGLPAQNLELEITESIMIEDIEYSIETMLKLREIGIKLSIDDFGTGYSSLAQIDRLPIQKIKVDKSFVHNLNKHTGSTLANSIIEMGHQLNLQILVEGVENKYQRKYFTKLNCHEGQGYYLGPPVPADKFASSYLKRQ